MAGMVTVERIVGKQEDVSSNLAYTDVNKAPLYLNLIKMGNVVPTSQTKISWVDYTSEGTQTTLKQKVSSSGETAFVVNDSSIFNNGCLAVIGDELVKITNISGDNLTVTRAQHSTSAGNSYEIGEEIFYVNDNIEEGADMTGATYKPGANYENVTQIIREEIVVSGTAQAIQVPSGDGVDAYTLEQIRKMDRAIGKTEKALISGTKFEDGNKRGMAGIKSFLAKGQVIDASNQEITQDFFGNLLKKIHAVGADLTGSYAFYVPGGQKMKISKLLKDYVKADSSENTLGAVATYIATDFGTFPIIISNNLRGNEILFINHDDLTLKPLANRLLQHQYLGITGDNIKGFIVSELTLEVRNIHTMGMITNLKK